MVSAKKATGINKVIAIIEKLKKELKEVDYLPKIYVVGCTNSGKSSFINAMIYKLNKFKNPAKIHYRSKYDVLTESPLPGTTMDFINVESVR